MLRAFALAFLLSLAPGKSPGQSLPAAPADAVSDPVAVSAEAPKLVRHVTDLTGTLTPVQASQLDGAVRSAVKRT